MIGRPLSDPLLQFLLIGAVLFAAGQAYRDLTSPQRVVIDNARVRQIDATYEREFGRPPTAIETAALINDYVEQEILYRRGVAMGLAGNDEIVRRRIIQKAEFLLEDQAPPREPTAADLETFLRAHPADYRTPPRATFSQVFFSTDRDGDAGARARATRALTSLQGSGRTRARELGDPSPDAYDYAGFGPVELQRQFGKSDLAAQVTKATPGRWSGPLRSGYGWHLVYLQGLVPPRSPALAEVRDLVRADYLRAERVRLNAAALERLRRGYSIVRSYGTPPS